MATHLAANRWRNKVLDSPADLVSDAAHLLKGLTLGSARFQSTRRSPGTNGQVSPQPMVTRS